MGWLRVIWAITVTHGYLGVCPPVKTGGFPAVGGRRGLRPLGKIPRLASLRLSFTRSGIAGRFSLRETLSINERAVTVDTSIREKLGCAFASKFFSACLSNRFLYSSGWESWGFFPHGKSSRLTTGGNGGNVDHGKNRIKRRRAIRWASWCFVDADNATRFDCLGGGASRNALSTLIRRLKPAASPALMERGAARTRRENRP